MIPYDTADLVCLYLDSLGDQFGASSAPATVTATGIGDALELGDTAGDRVSLLRTLSTLQDEGLVVAEERPVDGAESPRPVYTLSDTGRERAAQVHEQVREEDVVVTNGTRESISLGDIDRYLESETPLVTALVRLTDDGEVPLDTYTREGFVGRDGELAQVRDAIDRSMTQESETVVVEGASGMGKTALVREAVAQVRGTHPELQVARGSSPPGASEPYAAFQQVFADLDADTGLHQQLQADTTPEDPGELATQRQALFSDIADTLREVASAPLVVFLDNLQWADEATLALFEYLATTLDEWLTPVVFVGVYRSPAVVGTDHPLVETLDTIAAESPHTAVELEPFSETETRALLADLLERHSLPDAFVELVHEQTGGNPLFVRETATYLLETERVDPAAEVFPTDPEAVRLPEAVTDQIASRLDQLDAESRELLRLGAVMGERVPSGVLAAASDLPTARYREYVDVLVASHVWEHAGAETAESPRADGGRDLQFVSGGLREAVADRLPAGLTRTYHERAAAAFETVYGEDSDEYAARIAYHYEQAESYDRAVEYYQQAGAYAADQYANDEAVEHYERALSLAEEHETVEATAVSTVSVSLGNVLKVLGEFDHARACYERALDTIQEDGDEDAETMALLGLGSIARSQAKYDTAREYHQQALDIARESGDRDHEGQCLSGLGIIDRREGDYGRAHERLQQSVDIFRETGNRERMATGLDLLGVVAQIRGEYDRAREFHENALDIFRDLDRRSGQAQCLNNLGNLDFRLGNLDRAREYYDQSIDIFRETGNRVRESKALNNLALIADEEGAYDRAREYHEESLGIARELDDRKGQEVSLTNLGISAQKQGDYETAWQYYEESLDIAADIGDRTGEVSSLTNLADIARAQGAYDDSRQYCERAIELAQELGNPRTEAISWNIRAALALRQGAYDEAHEYGSTALDIAREIGDRKREVAGCYYLGATAVRRGRPARARESLTEAVDLARETDETNKLVHSLRELGSVAREHGADEQASEYLDDALDIARENGNPLLCARVRLECGRLALARGDVEEARRTADQVRSTVAALQATHFEARASVLQGQIAAVADTPEDAVACWQDALTTFLQVDAPQDALTVLEYLVDHCRAQGDDEQARAYREQARRVLDDAPEAVREQHREWVESAP